MPSTGEEESPSATRVLSGSVWFSSVISRLAKSDWSLSPDLDRNKVEEEFGSTEVSPEVSMEKPPMGWIGDTAGGPGRLGERGGEAVADPSFAGAV